jgi:hypothetical protein
MLKVTPFSATALARLTAAPFNLAAALENEVERLWQVEQRRRGKALFNGRIVSAVEVTSELIMGRAVDYRHWVAQRARPELFGELKIRPVGVAGLLRCPDGIVFGLRADSMTQDAGRWELCPSGSLNALMARADGVVEHRAQILAELREEIGIAADSVSEVRPFCLVDDLQSHVIDIGIALITPLHGPEILRIHRLAETNEYDELRVVPAAHMSQFLQDNRADIVAVSDALLHRALAYAPA